VACLGDTHVHLGLLAGARMGRRIGSVVDEQASILIVDDDPAFSGTFCDLLRARGYTPMAAADGHAALELAAGRPPRVAVIDLRLPDLSGLELMERIKQEFIDTECILLTGYASQESAIEALNLGAFSYLQKPYDVDQLLLHIQRASERWGAQRALKDSEERYRELVESANDIIYTHDMGGNFTSVNPAAAHVFGCTIDEASQLNIADVLDPEYLDLARRRIDEILADSSQAGPYELLTRSDHNEPLWLELSTRIVKRGDRPPEVQSIGRDVTDRRQVELALQREKERLDVVLEQFPFGVAIIRRDGRYEYVNPKFVEMFGYTLQDIPAGRDWFMRAYPDEGYRRQVMSTWLADLQGVQPGEARPRTFTVRCQDGSDKVVHFRPVTMEDGDQFVVCEDITEQQLAEETIKRLAYHDPLTGLANRALFDDRLEVAMAHARRNRENLAIMMLDLDYFKEVNDRLGHTAVDQLLQAVGQRLTTLLRESDTICRMGGDEFLVLLTGIAGTEVVTVVAERILDAIRKPFHLSTETLQITTSLGASVYPDDGDNGDTLITHADSAMYLAKELGRNNFQRYDPSQQQTRSIGTRAGRGRKPLDA
jgi:diguanylate cyclase (GGDEF)-like protein/PAS domain S-box-containing protein